MMYNTITKRYTGKWLSEDYLSYYLAAEGGSVVIRHESMNVTEAR